ncbi:hypothetical protein PoB_002998300 [Plakobranchus ocellatus]|uniref:Uncharacterized protein n=1 Tax=Plakobranchus ocellatus TaxID=259542 RepID=A0AAV4AA07_9GAST|nr:hypothetical protein PoB_002998300 [Plakobranchus ocellatus]
MKKYQKSTAGLRFDDRHDHRRTFQSLRLMAQDCSSAILAGLEQQHCTMFLWYSTGPSVLLTINQRPGCGMLTERPGEDTEPGTEPGGRHPPNVDLSFQSPATSVFQLSSSAWWLPGLVPFVIVCSLSKHYVR